VFDVAPGSFAMDQLALVEAVERLGHGVVVGITTRSNRGNGASVTQTFRVSDAEILLRFTSWAVSENVPRMGLF
jgi:hypothetical protein